MIADSADAARRRRQLVLLPLLALLHLALWAGLDMAWRKNSPALPAAESVQVSLLTLPARKQLPPQSPVENPKPSPKQTAGSTTSRAQFDQEAENERKPLRASAVAVEAIMPTQTSALPARLNLALPSQAASGAQRAAAQLAALDPRGNSHRPDMGERMALAVGSDPTLREEIINPGHRRFRQGSTCIDVNDTRDSQLHPFDEKTRGAKLASPCKD